MDNRRHSAAGWIPNDDRLFTLDVFIIDGPMTEAFAKKNRVICRTIQIRGDQTLEELHYVIFRAFDRWDQHLYEFQVGGKGPMDRKARRYGLRGTLAKSARGAPKAVGDVSIVVIGSLGLKVGDPFGYWFDFGDDWWHQINVADIDEKAPRGKYPKVTKRVGKSPPQYVDWDEEDEQ